MPPTIYVGSRSRFVTAIAWVFIALGLVATACSVLQHANAASLLPGLQHGREWPWMTTWLLRYLPWAQWTGLVLSAVMLGSAVGVLLRLNWARRMFIGVLVLAMVANVAGLWVQHELMQSLVSSTLGATTLPPAVAGVFGGFVTAARVMAVLVTLLACLLLGWIIRSLMSPGVRQEFAG